MQLSQKMISNISRIFFVIQQHSSYNDTFRAFQQKSGMKPLQLISSCKTRHMSANTMVKRFLMLLKPIVKTNKMLNIGFNLPNTDVKILTEFTDVMSHLIVMLKFSTQFKSNISALITAIKGLIKHFKKHAATTQIFQEIVADLVDDLKSMFFQYEQISIFLLSTIVDPRFKTSPFTLHFHQIWYMSCVNTSRNSTLIPVN